MWTIIIILLLFLTICIVFNFCSAFGETGSVIGAILSLAILLGAGHAWLCSSVWWYGEKVEPPEITINFKDGFFTKSNVEPLLGEEIIKNSDGNYSVILTDHRIHVDDYDKTPNLKISITPENATLKKGKTTLKITQFAMENPPRWYGYDSPNLKNKDTVLDKTFDFTINGGKLRYNENSDVEPTKYLIVAKNKRGQSSATLTVTRYPLYKACELYAENHPGHSPVDDVPLCKERADYHAAHKPLNDASNSSSSNSNNYPTNEPSLPSCSHYEAGRCWDVLEEEAYSQGQWDKLYGGYGDSYYESDDCDNICQNILEDAYDRGYDNY